MVVPVIHDVFTITHQVSINYITLNPVVRVGLREDEVSVIPGSLTKIIIKDSRQLFYSIATPPSSPIVDEKFIKFVQP